MGVGIIPYDDNGHTVLGLWDDATGTVIPLHIGAKVTGADGNKYAKLDVDVTVSVDPLNPQPVSGASGAFVAGSIVDLATIAAAISSSKMQANIAQMNGITPLIDALGQMTIEQFVQYQIMQGHGFSATTGLVATGATNAFICMQAAVNNIAKHVLIFSIQIGVNAVMNDGRIYTNSAATADSNLTSALTAYNLQPKSANVTALTTLAGSPAATTQTTGFEGNQSASFMGVGGSYQQLLQGGGYYYFASGDTASVEVAMKIPTSANSGSITMFWIEW